MVEAPIIPILSEKSKAAGQAILKVLDRNKFAVQGAAWVYSDLLGEWRYYVVTDLVELDGPLATYERMERLFSLKFNNPDLLIDDVHLGSPREDLFIAMATAIRVSVPRGWTMIDVRIGNYFVREAYVYRLDKTPTRAETLVKRKAFDRYLKQLEKA